MTEIKVRVGAIILKENKLLLVSAKGREEFWSPGGKIEENETDEECLKRELKEELGVQLVACKFYKEYMRKSFYHNYMLKSKMYIVSIKGEPKPTAEIANIHWLTKEEFEKKKIMIIPIINEELIPDLIKDKIFQ